MTVQTALRMDATHREFDYGCEIDTKDHVKTTHGVQESIRSRSPAPKREEILRT